MHVSARMNGEDLARAAGMAHHLLTHVYAVSLLHVELLTIASGTWKYLTEDKMFEMKGSATGIPVHATMLYVNLKACPVDIRKKC